MKLREAILEEHTKTNTVRITRWIGADEQRIAGLMQLFMHDEYRVVQRGRPDRPLCGRCAAGTDGAVPAFADRKA